ncbi:MAG: phosphatase PAP2 family protein, partial [Duncaniella sp.]|nr:phosphatase PAP2 family protein [Duncaniella sp.]
VAMHGFDFIPGTHGETAGLGRWDAMMGMSIFDGLYSRNSNVFAALPSLHAAYMLIAFIYSLRARCTVWLRILFAFICLGIWFTAVYTSHHYIIDVLAGIGVTILGWLLFEQVFMRIPSFRRFMSSYQNYISR